MRKIKYVLPVLFAGALVLGFQNCSDVGFSDGASVAPGPLAPGEIVESAGVDGGHFDLDTATEAYADNDGAINKHEHEYDEDHNTNTADFFNLIDDGYDEVQDTIAADQAFYLIVGNGDLSPRVAIEVNGVQYSSATKQLGPYSLSGAAGTQLNTFRAIVATDAITNGGLVPTEPGCVRRNEISADNRYRNGAFVIQAVPVADIGSVDPIRGVTSVDGTVLWETMIYWHKDDAGCR